ncbi:MAG: hypothetical protein AB1512_04150 [Thermodesulfobacteriota bacterium]
MTEESGIEKRLRGAERRVAERLAPHGVVLPPTRIVIDPEMGKDTLATHRHPDTVVVRDALVPESVIAHELIHIAQQTLEQFRGFRLLYSLLSEGLADWVARQFYPGHEVKYEEGCRLVDLLVKTDQKVIGDLLRLNDIPLTPGDLESILSSPHLPGYTRDLLNGMADRIRESICAAQKAGITDPTFVPLGEEVRVWKFLLDGRFEGVREKVDKVVEERLEHGRSCDG